MQRSNSPWDSSWALPQFARQRGHRESFRLSVFTATTESEPGANPSQPSRFRQYAKQPIAELPRPPIGQTPAARKSSSETRASRAQLSLDNKSLSLRCAGGLIDTNSNA